MAWSIAQVARMSGASARMLRHYDAIGLLPPAWVGENGYRYYEQGQLVRLQQILLLRELDVGLEAIASILAGEKDPAQVLRRHRDLLLAERGRLDALVHTVSTTIDELERGIPVSTENMFSGFDRAALQRGQVEMREWLIEKYGQDQSAGIDEKFASSEEVTRNWTDADYQDSMAAAREIDERLAALVRAGAAPDGAETFAVLDDHYAALTAFWTPDRDSYTGLGQMYAEHEQFRTRYTALHPALPEFLREATAAYARARL